MAWYQLAKKHFADVMTTPQVNFLFDQKERNKFVNSPPKTPMNVEKDPSDAGIEDMLNPERANTILNPQKVNEARQPIRTKSTGQGADALLNTNKDLPMYSDNFVNTSDWNTL